MVFKKISISKSVLFKGDLGTEDGDKFLMTGTSDLKADYVQMTHHGQGGVNKKFYKDVGAKYVLWLSLFGCGRIGLVTKDLTKTLEVREGMGELRVIANYVSGLDKTIQID